MRFKKALAATTGAGILLAGCARPVIGHGEYHSDLRFSRHITDNGSAVSCAEGEETGGDYGVGLLPYNPKSKETYTYGVAPSEHDLVKLDNHALLAGATMMIIGRTTIEVATSDDPRGKSHLVDLARRTFSAVLHATKTFDIELSVREDTIPGDNTPYATMQITCLDHGNFVPRPHVPFSTGPNTITLSPAPSPTVS